MLGKALAVAAGLFGTGAFLSAQVQVTASGSLAVAASVSPSPQTATVTGATTLSVPQFGSVTLTVGPTSLLTLVPLSPPNPWSGWWTSTSGIVLLELTSPVPTAGVLRLHAVPACAALGPASMMIDVDDDGSAEAGLLAPGPIDVPVVLGSRPVRVRLIAQSVNWGATCQATLEVAFVPQPAQLQVLLPACGPDVAATLRAPAAGPGLLRLEVGGMDGVLGVLFAGATPLAPTGCGPFTTADATMLLTPSPAGARVDVPLAPALIGTARVQYVDLSLPFALEWSNGVQLTLP